MRPAGTVERTLPRKRKRRGGLPWGLCGIRTPGPLHEARQKIAFRLLGEIRLPSCGPSPVSGSMPCSFLLHNRCIVANHCGRVTLLACVRSPRRSRDLTPQTCSMLRLLFRCTLRGTMSFDELLGSLAHEPARSTVNPRLFGDTFQRVPQFVGHSNMSDRCFHALMIPRYSVDCKHIQRVSPVSHVSPCTPTN